LKSALIKLGLKHRAELVELHANLAGDPTDG
jgi:hypothetical protein